jgi:hypothetical protein
MGKYSAIIGGEYQATHYLGEYLEGVIQTEKHERGPHISSDWYPLYISDIVVNTNIVWIPDDAPTIEEVMNEALDYENALFRIEVQPNDSRSHHWYLSFMFRPVTNKVKGREGILSI